MIFHCIIEDLITLIDFFILHYPGSVLEAQVFQSKFVAQFSQNPDIIKS